MKSYVVCRNSLKISSHRSLSPSPPTSAPTLQPMPSFLHLLLTRFPSPRVMISSRVTVLDLQMALKARRLTSPGK